MLTFYYTGDVYLYDSICIVGYSNYNLNRIISGWLGWDWFFLMNGQMLMWDPHGSPPYYKPWGTFVAQKNIPHLCGANARLGVFCSHNYLPDRPPMVCYVCIYLNIHNVCYIFIHTWYIYTSTIYGLCRHMWIGCFSM
jgi:hypothetical protein